jgi:hypothetical protein
LATFISITTTRTRWWAEKENFFVTIKKI